MCDIPCPTVGEQRPRHRRQTLRQISLWQMCQNSGMVKAIPHNSKCRYGERGAADAKPKAQIILDAAKVSAASGGCSEPKQGQRSQSARGFCPRCTMRVPQPDIIEHFGNADAGAVLKPQGGNCAVLPQDRSLQSKVSCAPNRKTTGGTVRPLAAAEKRCQCIKHAAAQLYYPYTTPTQQ